MATVTPTPIDRETEFGFRCGPQVGCFNDCCRDLVQLLTPYDVLRLRRHLGLNSAAFLRRYTRSHVGPQTGLPVVTLAAADARERRCPFVTEAGCRVYPDRPSSCRLYPLVRTVGRHPATGRLTEAYFLLAEPHCRGHETAHRQSVAQWIDGQGLAEYLRQNDRLMELIVRKRRRRPGPLPAAERQQAYTALYDLDTLRGRLAAGARPAGMPAGEDELAGALADDAALLELSLRWLAADLFGPPPGGNHPVGPGAL